MTRTLAILAYFFIFLQGMLIKIPFGLLLMSGLFEAEPLTRVFIALTDIFLIILLIVSFKEKSKWTLSVEIISYFVLLLPLMRIFTSFPFDMFNYFSFLFPAICFALLYPLSVYFSYRAFKKTNQVAEHSF